MNIRASVVAGRFYPADRKTLEQDLKNYIIKKDKIKNAFAIIAPHAGYMYSGKTAGAVYSCVEIPDVVFVLSPNHTGLGSPISLDPSESWSTPLGAIKVELDILKKIKEKLPMAEFDSTAQKREHALEVQLPFIQTLNPNAKIVPITLSGLSFNTIQKLGAVVSETIIAEEEKTGKRPLIVASSDMTHFESADSAKRKDMLAIDQIKKLDTKTFLETVEKNDISLCGLYTIPPMIEAALHYSKTKKTPIKVDLVDYTNSGMVTGDNNEVVAYAGVVLHSQFS
jgi:MEMO1 family protein